MDSECIQKSCNYASSVEEDKCLYINKLKCANGLSQLRDLSVEERGHVGEEYSYKFITDCNGMNKVRQDMSQKCAAAEEKAMKGVSSINIDLNFIAFVPLTFIMLQTKVSDGIHKDVAGLLTRPKDLLKTETFKAVVDVVNEKSKLITIPHGEGPKP